MPATGCALSRPSSTRRGTPRRRLRRLQPAAGRGADDGLVAAYARAVADGRILTNRTRCLSSDVLDWGTLPERLARLVDLEGKVLARGSAIFRWHLGYDTEHGRIRCIDPGALYEGNPLPARCREPGIEKPKVKRPLEELVIE